MSLNDESEASQLLFGRAETKRPVPLAVRAAVEFLGTLTFVLFGAGTAAHLGLTDGGAPSVAAAGAHGVVTMVLIYLWADISGAYFNAGPTITDILRRQLPLVDGLVYLVVQACGCLTAGGILRGIYHSMFKDSGTFTLGTPTFNPALGIDSTSAFFIEFLGGTLLMMAAYTSGAKGHGSGVTGLAVGGSLFVIFLFGATLDGAAMNPWRWLGPAVASQTFQPGWWIYIVGSPAGFMFGFLIAAALHRWIPSPSKDE